MTTTESRGKLLRWQSFCNIIHYMKLRAIIAVLFLFPVTIFAQNWTNFAVNTDKMQLVLDDTRSLKNLPRFKRMPTPNEFEGFETCQAEKDEEILKIFSELNFTFFSRIKIPLFRCKWEQSTGSLLNDGIFLSNSEVEFLNKNTSRAEYIANMKFTLAHEIAHYVYELSTLQPISKKLNYSVNNYPSYTLEKYDTCEKLKREDQKMECELNLWFFGHSEVDIYAALVLKQMGFQDWEIVRSGTEVLARDIMNGMSPALDTVAPKLLNGTVSGFKL